MQDDSSGNLLTRIKKTKRDAAPSPAAAEHAELIARLESEIAAERTRSAELATTVDGLQFKLDVQERSYAKQLTDARLRLEETGQQLDERQRQLAELGRTHEDTLRELADIRARLERVTAGSADAAHWGAPAGSDPYPRDETQPPEDTINRLLSVASGAAAGAPPPDARASNHLTSAPEPPDAPPEELLAPELLFSRKQDED